MVRVSHFTRLTVELEVVTHGASVPLDMKALLVSFALALAPVTVAACGGPAQQVEMKGDNDDLVSLAGDWEGSYTVTESGRSGPISFDLELGRHTAQGTVLLAGQTPLRIEFVAVEGGTLSGKIDPYTDPSCNCQVQTEFVGTQTGDAITGSFTTTVLGQNVEQHGSWSVTRKPKA